MRVLIEYQLSEALHFPVALLCCPSLQWVVWLLQGSLGSDGGVGQERCGLKRLSTGNTSVERRE